MIGRNYTTKLQCTFLTHPQPLSRGESQHIEPLQIHKKERSFFIKAKTLKTLIIPLLRGARGVLKILLVQ